jgi:hypothetical protein
MVGFVLKTRRGSQDECKGRGFDDKKLSSGLAKSLEIFHSVKPGEWAQPIFEQEDSWDLKDLMAYFMGKSQEIP